MGPRSLPSPTAKRKGQRRRRRRRRHRLRRRRPAHMARARNGLERRRTFSTISSIATSTTDAILQVRLSRRRRPQYTRAQTQTPPLPRGRNAVERRPANMDSATRRLDRWSRSTCAAPTPESTPLVPLTTIPVNDPQAPRLSRNENRTRPPRPATPPRIEPHPRVHNAHRLRVHLRQGRRARPRAHRPYQPLGHDARSRGRVERG